MTLDELAFTVVHVSKLVVQVLDEDLMVLVRACSQWHPLLQQAGAPFDLGSVREPVTPFSLRKQCFCSFDMPVCCSRTGPDVRDVQNLIAMGVRLLKLHLSRHTCGLRSMGASLGMDFFSPVLGTLVDSIRKHNRNSLHYLERETHKKHVRTY